MTAPLDLEALRAALDAMPRSGSWLSSGCTVMTDSPAKFIATIGSPAVCDPTIIAALVAELTARRARDAEVEALVAAAQGFFDAQCNLDNREAMGPNADDHDTLMRRRNAARRELDAALAPFTGAKP